MSRLIFSNIFSTYLSRIWIGIISFFSVPYLIKRLGIDAYGVFSLSLIFIGYSALFDFGLGRGAVKYIAEFKVFNNIERLQKLIKSCFFVYLVIGLVSSVSLALFTHFFLGKIFRIPDFLSKDALTVFYLTSFYLVIRVPQLLFQAIAMGYQKVYLLNIINTIFNSLKILASVAVACFTPNLGNIVFANIIVGMLHFIFLYSFVKNILPNGTIALGYEKDSINGVFKYSVKSFVADSLGMLITYVDKIIIGIFLPIASLAYYSVSFDLTIRLCEFQVSATTSVFPTFSSHHAASLKGRFRRLYIKLTKLMVIISAFFSSTLCFFSKEILTLWVGADVALSSYHILQVISWGILTGSLLAIIGTIFYSVGNINKVIKINTLMFFSHLAMCILFIKKFGLICVAVSWIITQIIGIFLLIPWINKNIAELKNSRYLLEFLKPTALSIIVVYIFYFFSRGRLNNTMGFLTEMLSMGIIYIVLLWFIIITKEEKSYFKQILRGKLKWSL